LSPCTIKNQPGHQWLTPIILAIQKAEIRKIAVQSHQGRYFMRPYLEKSLPKKRAGGVA
jgi:hypothetical protein